MRNISEIMGNAFKASCGKKAVYPYVCLFNMASADSRRSLERNDIEGYRKAEARRAHYWKMLHLPGYLTYIFDTK